MDPDMLAAMANEAQADARVTAETNTDPNQKDVTAVEDEIGNDTQDFSRTPWDERTPEERGETEEPSKTETETETDKTDTETKTNTETPASTEEAPAETPEAPEVETVDPNEWLKTLPPAPAELNLKAPEYDEEGNVVNMTGQEFLEYVTQTSQYATRVENYNQTVLNRSMDEAEKILPEIKTSEVIRQLFENQLVAMTVNGQGTAVDAAREIAKLRSDSSAEGAQSAKSRIEVVKNSAVESPSKSNTQENKPIDKKLAQRLKANDSDAFDELFLGWIDEGKI